MGYVRLEDYWDWMLEQEDLKKVFCVTDNVPLRRELFNKYVYTINLELSAYCNRSCSYCPVSIYPRKQELMTSDIFQKVLDNLEFIRYTGGISLNLFNEPLYDDLLEERIRQIKEKLPSAYIYFNSNGDKLSSERIESLWNAGLSRILITIHTASNEEWNDDKKREEFKRFLKKIGKVEYYEKREEQEGRSIIVTIPYEEKRCIILKCNNWARYGNDRGGVLKDLSIRERLEPCMNPVREFSIAYDGSIKLCCNIYFESPDCGNIMGKGILDFYFGEQLVSFRKKLFRYGEKVSPCSTCNTGIEMVSDNNLRKIREIF